MFLSSSEWDWSLGENWKIHWLLLQWNLGTQVQCNARALLSQTAVLSLSRMKTIRFVAPTSLLLCKFGVWSKKGASFFVIQNTEKEMRDPFTTSRSCLCQQSINATRFKHLLSVRESGNRYLRFLLYSERNIYTKILMKSYKFLKDIVQAELSRILDLFNT